MEDNKVIPLEHHLQILEAIEQNSQVTQLDLATTLGVAVGTVNWYIKRLISKGYVRIARMQRKRLAYFITPRGIAEKSRLGVAYVRASLKIYRNTRVQAMECLKQVRRSGYDRVVIKADGDVGEICRLTCLEQRILTVSAPPYDGVPALHAEGWRLRLIMPEK